MIRTLAPIVLLAAAAGAAPRIPKDAPYCAAPSSLPLFVSPMGEPFRAARGAPYPSALWFAGADRSGDGAVDRAEFVRDADRFFRLLDRDHDGRLVPDEVIAYERDVTPEIALYGPQAREPQRRTRAPRAGESGYGGPMGAGRYAWLNIPEPVSSADADVDRVIGEREFAAAAARRFDGLDGAGSGRLVLAALPRTPAQIAIEGPCEPRPTRKPGRDGEPYRDGGLDSDRPEPRR